MKPYTAIIGVFFVIVLLTPYITETTAENTNLKLESKNKIKHKTMDTDSLVEDSTSFEVINEIKKGDITLNTLEIEGHDYLLVSKQGFTAITHSETCKCWKDYNSL